MTIKYKLPRPKKLTMSKRCLDQIKAAGAIQCTQAEAAAVLGCSHKTLSNFFRENPEAKQAWKEGRQEGRASLRRLLWDQAQRDPAQARFLAKDSRWLSMDEGKDRHIKAEAEQQQRTLSQAERIARIMELQRRVLDGGKLTVTEPPVLEADE